MRSIHATTAPSADRGCRSQILPTCPLHCIQVQETIIGGLYNTLTASLDSDDEQLLDYSFTQQLRLAHKAEVFSVWPCAAMPAGQTNQVTVKHDLPTLITRAQELERLPELLAILHVLLRTLPPCSTTTSPHLLDTLDLLATCKRSTSTPDECKYRLDKILTPWIQPLQLIVSDRTFGKSTDQLSDNSLAAISSAMQQQTSSADMPHSSAVQPYTAEAENRNIAPQQVCPSSSSSCPSRSASVQSCRASSLKYHGTSLPSPHLFAM